jgi:hypothetical protein
MLDPVSLLSYKNTKNQQIWQNDTLFLAILGNG